MLQWLRNKLQLKKSDNKGSAIIIVILAVAFVGMLVSMIVYMTMVNYKMKYTDRSAKNNFYSAETALDEINVGLQGEISKAMTNAYSDVMKSAAAKTDEDRAKEFKKIFIKEMDNNINDKKTVSNPTAALFVEKLKGYWINTPKIDYSTAGSFGASLTLENMNDALINRYVVDEDNGYITLKGIKITYTNENGFVSIIKTDIVMEIPEINFMANADTPNLQKYSLIANEKLSKTGGGKVDITGSVFGGKEGIFAENPSVVMNFKYQNADLEENATVTDFVVSAEEMNVSNGALISSGKVENPPLKRNESKGEHEIWVRNINTVTAKIDLKGDIYVQDDLNIDGTDYNGHGSNIKLSGSYIGYGDAGSTAKASSSILINGAKTTLDMSGLEELVLGGHAYVGATHYDANAKADDSYIADLDEASVSENSYYNTPAYSVCPEHGYIEGVYDACPHVSEVTTTTSEGEVKSYKTCGKETKTYSYSKNDEDIILGQSIAMKSDQLIYMVPTECMCYDNETGEQVLAKNPLTYDEYIRYTTTYLPLLNTDNTIRTDNNGNIMYSDKLKYRVVDLGKTFNKLGTALQANYGVSYKPVFRKVSGTVLVYYYLFFDTETQANKFFYDYYQEDPETIQKYANSYIEKITLNPNIERDGLLSLGGNIITYNNTNNTFGFKKSTYENEIQDSDTYMQTQKTREGYYASFEGLNHYLMSNTKNITAGQLSKDVYENIVVDDDEFAEIVAKGYFKEFTRTVDTDNYKAVGVNNEGVGTFKVSQSPDANIILASGDVLVDVTAYKGLIIAGGEITISDSCTSIDYDSDNVLYAMSAKNAAGDSFYKLLRNGIQYANVSGVAEDSTTIDADLIEDRKEDYYELGKLIQYDNWSKE